MADSIHRKKLLILLNIAYFLPIIVLALWSHHPRWTWAVPLAGLAMGGVMGLLLPITESMFPFLVPRSQLLRVNAQWEALNYTAALAGPILGGVILAHGRFPSVVAMMAGLVAASLFIRIFWHYQEDIAPQRGRSAPPNFTVVSRLRKHPSLRWGIFYSWVTNCLLAPVSSASMLIILLRVRLQLPLVAIVPWLAAANGVPWLFNQLLGRRSTGLFLSDGAIVKLLGWGVLGQGVGMGLVGASTSPEQAFAGIAINLTSVTLYTTHWRLLRQRATPKAWIGRVSGVSRSLAYSGYIVGGLAGLFVLPDTTLPTLALICSSGVVLFALVTLVIHYRRPRIAMIPSEETALWLD